MFTHSPAIRKTRKANRTFFEILEESPAAADAVNSFTRMKMREDGFFRRIMPPLQISDDELDRSTPPNGPPATLGAMIEIGGYELEAIG